MSFNINDKIHETTYEGNVTTVVLHTGPVTGTGIARCRPDDVFSKKTGELIALGRAIQDIGRQVEGIGDAAVVTYAEADRVLGLIDEIADESGATTMPVGSSVDAQIQELRAAEDDEIINKYLSMFFDDLKAGKSATAASEGCSCGQCNPSLNGK